MANALYDKGREKFLSGNIAFHTDTIQATLVSSSYTPDTANHEFYTSISAHVLNTNQTLASKTVTNGVADADDVTFTSVTADSVARYVVLSKSGATAATSPLIAVIDTATGLPTTTNGGDILVRWDNGANRIFKL